MNNENVKCANSMQKEPEIDFGLEDLRKTIAENERLVRHLYELLACGNEVPEERKCREQLTISDALANLIDDVCYINSRLDSLTRLLMPYVGNIKIFSIDRSKQ